MNAFLNFPLKNTNEVTWKKKFFSESIKFTIHENKYKYDSTQYLLKIYDSDVN